MPKKSPFPTSSGKSERVSQRMSAMERSQQSGSQRMSERGERKNELCERMAQYATCVYSFVVLHSLCDVGAGIASTEETEAGGIGGRETTEGGSYCDV